MNSRLKIITSFAAIVIVVGGGAGIYKTIKSTPQKTEILVPPANAVAIPAISQGVTVEQSFVTNLSHLSEVSFYGATYLRKNLPGSGTFQLLNTDKTVLVSQNFPLSALKDNSYFTLRFKSLHLTPGSQYFVTLTSSAKSSIAIFTLWSNQGFQNNSFVLRENGKTLKGSAIFNLTGN